MVKRDIRNVLLQVRFLPLAPLKKVLIIKLIEKLGRKKKMIEYNVGGSPVKNKLFIQSSLNEDFDFVSITIGIEEILTALDDVVSDRDMLKKEELQNLINELEYNLNKLKE